MYDFFVGREQQPCLGPLNLKFFFIRYGMMSWVTINAVFLWKSYSEGSVTPALVFVVVMQTLSVLDHVWHEVKFVMLFEIGLGYSEIHIAAVFFPITTLRNDEYSIDISV